MTRVTIEKLPDWCWQKRVEQGIEPGTAASMPHIHVAEERLRYNYIFLWSKGDPVGEVEANKIIAGLSAKRVLGKYRWLIRGRYIRGLIDPVEYARMMTEATEINTVLDYEEQEGQR